MNDPNPYAFTLAVAMVLAGLGAVACAVFGRSLERVRQSVARIRQRTLKLETGPIMLLPPRPLPQPPPEHGAPAQAQADHSDWLTTQGLKSTRVWREDTAPSSVGKCACPNVPVFHPNGYCFDCGGSR